MTEYTRGQSFDLLAFDRIFGKEAGDVLRQGLGSIAIDEPGMLGRTTSELRGLVRALLPYTDYELPDDRPLLEDGELSKGVDESFVIKTEEQIAPIDGSNSDLRAGAQTAVTYSQQSEGSLTDNVVVDGFAQQEISTETTEPAMVSKAGIRMLTKVIGHGDVIKQLTVEEAKELLHIIEDERTKHRRAKEAPSVHRALMAKLELTIEGASAAEIAERFSSTSAAVSVSRKYWADKAVELTAGKLPDANVLFDRIGATRRLGSLARDSAVEVVGEQIPNKGELSRHSNEHKNIEELLDEVTDRIIDRLGYDAIPREKVLELVKNTLSKKVYGEIELSFANLLKQELERGAPSYQEQASGLGLTKKEWQLLSVVSGLQGRNPVPLHHRSKIQGSGNGQSGQQIVQSTFLSGVLKLLGDTREPTGNIDVVGQDFLALSQS